MMFGTEENDGLVLPAVGEIHVHIRGCVRIEVCLCILVGFLIDPRENHSIQTNHGEKDKTRHCLMSLYLSTG